MARFLVATLPLMGHINPTVPVVRALLQRGHEVWWYSGRHVRAAIEASGARYVPMQAAARHDTGTLSPALPPLRGLMAANWGLKQAFIDPIPGQVADLQAALAQFPADVLLADQVFLGAEATHALGGPPWATLGISALTISSHDTAPFNTGLPPDSSPLGRLRNRLLNALLFRVALADAARHLNYVRWTLGLAPLRADGLDLPSPFLYLHSGTAAFSYPRSDLPPQVHFVGPLLPETPADFTPSPWWEEIQGARTVVLVSQGTVATQPEQLLVPTLRALADEDVLVVATTGGATPARLGLALPTNARIAPFLPFGALMPHMDVMVTNGGYGGVQCALAHGVPLVVAGASEEKPAIAALVAWSGAGLNLRTGTPTAEQIRAAVSTVLADDRYARHARRIQADYQRHDAPRQSVELLERLAATQKPVLRERALAEQLLPEIA